MYIKLLLLALKLLAEDSFARCIILLAMQICVLVGTERSDDHGRHQIARRLFLFL